MWHAWCRDLQPPASLSLQTFSWELLPAATCDGTAGLILGLHLRPEGGAGFQSNLKEDGTWFLLNCSGVNA